MIQATGFPLNIAYAEKIARQYGASNGKGMAIIDQVTISPEGQAMNQAISQAVNQGEEAKPLNPGEFPKIPSWWFNFAEASQHAERGLQAAMQQLGIPANTHVSMKINTDGTITVESGSTKNAKLEAVVNNNMDLRNAVVATQNAAYMNRVGHAVEEAQRAGAANPSKADYYNNWAVNVAQQIMSMGFEFDFTDGKLAGSFLSGGQKIGLNEHLETLPA